MKMSRPVLLVLYSLVFLLLANLLHAFFLSQKKFEDVLVTYKVQSEFDTWTWLSTQSSNGEALKMEPTKVSKNKPTIVSQTITNTQGIKFVGVYWNYSNKGNFTIQDISIKSNRKAITYSSALDAIEYHSDNLNITLKDDALIATSSLEDTANGWLMLKEEGIQKVTAFKWFKPFSIATNGILLILTLIFLFWKKALIDLMPFLKNWNVIKGRLVILFLWMFLLPFWPIISHILLVISLLFTIIQYKKEPLDFDIKKLKYFTPIIILFFLIIVVDVLFHSAFLLKNISHYSYLLCTPFLFLGLKKEHLKSCIKVLHFSTILYTILFLLACCERYLTGAFSLGFSEYVFETLNVYWHTSYFAGLLIIPLFFIYSEEQVTIKHIIIILYALGFLLITKARLPFLASIFIFAILSLRFIHSKCTKISLITVFLGLILISSFFLISTETGRKNIHKIISTEKQQSDVRPELWTAAIKAIYEKPWIGYGSKNVQSTIVVHLTTDSKIKLRNYNAHNQYLEWSLSHGVFMSIALLVVLLVPLFTLKRIPYFFMYILLVMIVESYLVRQSGIILFSFFYSYFIVYDRKG